MFYDDMWQPPRRESVPFCRFLLVMGEQRFAGNQLPRATRQRLEHAAFLMGGGFEGVLICGGCPDEREGLIQLRLMGEYLLSLDVPPPAIYGVYGAGAGVKERLVLVTDFVRYRWRGPKNTKIILHPLLFRGEQLAMTVAEGEVILARNDVSFFDEIVAGTTFTRRVRTWLTGWWRGGPTLGPAA